ncbi:Ferrichrome ABC transporter, ATP-binding protein [Mycoplasma haemocanis str. Illinois]|uniref:Ferrichrome ABC transporter, ATP-binding protein n=1 Tax=Mycoplasma haemocanis (strain Illinois) TaxID=1111676 RepID=H6N7Y5_MYCHN|nr:ATP-binding cassette domain-containing protein [Mycoplasma haemocanis]AEW45757.1 Ferrichrome ABC transporter, ATP-binding protein [Mycoplasma haemocanis str. Illinois]
MQFRKYLREIGRYFTGYYVDMKRLISLTRWLHYSSITLIIALAISVTGVQLLNHHFPNLHLTNLQILVGDYESYVSKSSLDQSKLTLFVPYVIFIKMGMISGAILLMCIPTKIWLANAIDIQDTTMCKKVKSRIFWDIAFNPIFPLYSHLKFKNKNLVYVERKPLLSLANVMNNLLKYKSFPPIVNGSTLIKIKGLSFMYHEDKGLYHLLLKTFLPKAYERHLLKENSRRKSEERSLSNLPTLKNINLKLDASKFITILGCNGSSKTTFIKAIINLFEKYSGEIVWITEDLKNISHKSFYSNVSYIAQNTLIHSKISVYDFVACGLFPSMGFFQLNYSSEHPLVLENLRKMDLLEMRDKNLDSLSGGEKQKAIIARALTQQTKVIILDEPTTYLDIKNQYLILNILKKLQNEEGKTIIAILHDLKQAKQFSDEIVILDDGAVFAYGETQKVMNERNIRRVFGINYSI